MGVSITSSTNSLAETDRRTAIGDALIGYGLSGDVRSPADEYIDWMNDLSGQTVSLDVPSGIDATTGKPLGGAVAPDRTVTPALPKTGLGSLTGALYLVDISILQTVYDRLDIEYKPPFGDEDWVRLEQ